MENKFTNIKDRVVQIAEKQDMSKESFFRSIGMTSASFRGKAKESPLNSNAIVNIITKYPEVDLYWLLSGKTKNAISGENNLAEELGIEYKRASDEDCEEKEELIKLLKEQIADLKSDKEDLKLLLGLKK